MVESLKNYGKSLPECMRSISPETQKRAKKIAMGVLRKELGLWSMMRFFFKISKERKRLMSVDLSSIRQKIPDERFIQSLIDDTALFSAMEQVAGMEKTIQVHYEILDKTALMLQSEIFPDPEKFNQFEDPFGAFKDYALKLMDADQKLGVHLYKLTENSDQALQMDVHSCAWYDVRKLLGIPEAALPSCYGDDVFFPAVVKDIDLQYLRTKTLARGHEFCDFRFEKRE